MKQFYYLIALIFLSSWMCASGSLKNPNRQSAFIENKGQIMDQYGKPNSQVKYLFHSAGLNVQLRANGFSYDTYQFIGGPNHEVAYHRVDIDLVGSNPDARLVGELPAEDVINVHLGNKEISGIHSFERVVYKDIYPNIDLVFERSGNADKNIEYNFVVHPGGDASLIKLNYIGANRTGIKDKKINISVSGGNFTETIPASFVVSNYSNQASPVKQKQASNLVAAYKHLGNSVYTFDVADYDQSKTLVIDPTPTLEWGTYYDGNASGTPFVQSGQAVVYDPAGNVYMTGYTTSSQNISTSGSHQFIIGANSVDAYVVKFNSSGVRQWATYYGGNNNDYATNITIDASGNIYVCGYTGSPTQIASAGSHQTAFGGVTGDEDAFVVKFNSNGVRQWGTYYGGSSPDRAYGVAVDASGNVFLTGITSSSSAISTAGSHQASLSANQDAFLAKFNSSGVRQWGTYYGDTGNDWANEVAVDGAGDVYIGGVTNALGTFATPGAFQTAPAQGFMAKFNTSGVRQWGTFINATIEALAVDATGDIYLTGYSGSTTGIATAGTHQTAPTGSLDAIIMKFTNAGTRTWGTYYGGTSNDAAYDIAVDNANHVYITGTTQSDTHANLVSDCAYKIDPYHENNVALGNTIGRYPHTSAFIAKFDAMIGTRQWGTFYLGNDGDRHSQQDYGYGIATANNAAGDIYFSGTSHSRSGNYTEVTRGAYDTLIVFTSYGASILAKFNEGSVSGLVNPLPAPVNAINAFPGTTICSGIPLTLSLGTGTLTPGSTWTWYEYSDSDIPASLAPIGTGTNIVVTNTLVGRKTYLVRAENSCAKSACRFIVIETNPNPDEPNTADTTYACQGSALFLSSNGSPSNTSNYGWAGPGGFSANSQTVIVTNTTTMAHTGWYYITNTNSYGCEKRDSTYVRVGNALNVTVTPSSISICQGDTVKLNSTSNLVGSSFRWAIPFIETPNYGTGTPMSGTQNTFTTNLTSYQHKFVPPRSGSSNSYWYDYSGTYTLTVRNGGCQQTFTVPVQVRTAPTASLITPGSMPYDADEAVFVACPGAGYTFSATPVAGATYSWSGRVHGQPITFTATTQNVVYTPSVNPNLSNYSWVSYTVTDTHGCNNSEAVTFKVFTNNNPPLVDTLRPCVGTSFDFSNSGASSTQTYTWTGPGGYTSNSMNPSFTNANSPVHDGNYVANMTIPNQYFTIPLGTQTLYCQSRDSVRVLVKASPTTTITHNPSVCLNSPLSFSATPAAFVTNNDYVWNSPIFSTVGQTITANPGTPGPATVTLTLTDNFGCIGTVTTSVMVNDLPNVTVASNSPICEKDTIRLTSMAPSATSYSWTTVGTGTATVLTNSTATVFAPDVNAAGLYKLEVTDANGCKNSTGQNVIVNYTPILLASNTATICQKATINLNAYGYLNSGSALGGNLLRWTGPNTYTATGPSQTITNASPIHSGKYIVSATLNGCKGKDSVQITVNPLPMVTATNNSAICAGDTLKLSGMPNNLNYAWTVPSGFNSSNQNLVLPNAAPIQAGTYTLTATDLNGCAGSAVTTVTINPAPVATIANATPAVCEGGTISLSTATVSGNTYQWSGPNGFSASSGSVSINNAVMNHSGVYSLTVTNSNGCKAYTSTSVTVNYTPILSASSTGSVVCQGGTIGLQANAYTSNGFVINGGYIFWAGPSSFSGIGNVQNIPNATSGMTGTYTVTVSLGNCSATQTVAILVNNTTPSLTVSSNSQVCPGAAITLSVTAVSGATYNWSGPNGFTSSTQNPVINNAVTQMSGVYTVTVAAGSCASVGTTSVTVSNVASVVPTSNSPVCVGESILLNAPLISGATYAWSGPNSYTSAVQNPTITNAAPSMSGTYTVTASFGSCSSSGTLSVVVNNTVTLVPVSNSPVCTGGSITLGVPTIPGATYAWSGPNAYTSAVQNPTITNAAASMGGTYTVTASFGSCSSTGTVSVVVNSNTVTVSPTSNSPVCIGGTINLATPTIAGATYAWSGPNSYTSAVQNPTITNAATAMSGTYTLTARFGSCSSTGTVSVSVTDPSALSVTASGTTTLCVGSAISLNASAVNNGSYTWSGPNGFSASTQNTTINNADATMSGTYTVVVKTGCGSVSDNVKVDVQNCIPNDVSVPEGFSPNGDGVNEYFVIKGISNYPKNTMIIFNRWGIEVYKATPYHNHWDGRVQKETAPSISGDELPVGTYFYVLDLGDGSKIMKGYIYLTR